MIIKISLMRLIFPHRKPTYVLCNVLLLEEKEENLQFQFYKYYKYIVSSPLRSGRVILFPDRTSSTLPFESQASLCHCLFCKYVPSPCTFCALGKMSQPPNIFEAAAAPWWSIDPCKKKKKKKLAGVFSFWVLIGCPLSATLH